MEDKELAELILSIGQRIRELRKEQNMTQLDLGIKSGMEENAVQRLETARTSPTIKTLHRIAKGLNVELRELF
ncbi:hypothetical protein IMCC3317_34580 [Kordia antarctica]|uniref:HTH cro/C1-type domain-containing protein n=1 Tax=Kordia antarctica TaxID=1218801 RepID=A0A7L4ZQC5_9FLAO|nr:hypothetical protein IMCC3317_34580 [Kordia antarctica]